MIFAPTDHTDEEARADERFAAIREVDTTMLSTADFARLMRERPRVSAN